MLRQVMLLVIALVSGAAYLVVSQGKVTPHPPHTLTLSLSLSFLTFLSS